MESEFTEKYLPLLKHYSIPIALGLIGLICLGYGMIDLNQQKSIKTDILSGGATTQSSAATAISPAVKQQTLIVDVEGAVLKPGVYHLPADSRIQDALIAAGGLSAGADRHSIAKNLNLADRLSDGSKIYIPFSGETVGISTQETVLGAQTGSININTATESDLDGLPGIGAVTAAKIISQRPYTSRDELVEKKIIGEKEFEKIKEMITTE